MIAALKPYTRMKDSGVPWLGEVPEHWDVKPHRALFEEVKNQNHPNEPLLSVTISKGVIRQSELLSETSKKDSSNLDKSKYKLVRPGEIVYNKMRAWQGAVGMSRYRGIVSPAYIVQRPRKGVLGEYMHYLLRTPGFAKEAERWSYGITSDQWSLRPEHFKMIYSCLPPLDEQKTIVRFLNHIDRRIGRYIRAKKRLITLLEELKQAVIYRAVTRGLDPNIRLKPSGVEWLGDVPENWTIAALRLRYSQSLGKMLDSKRIIEANPLPYLRNIDVQWDEINTSNLPVMDIAPSEYKRYTVRNGDLLVCEGGEVGRCAIWNGDIEICGFQKALHRLRPHSDERDLPRFLYYVFRVATTNGAFNDGHESTIAHLTGDKLRAHRFPFPEMGEQIAIVKYLDEATSGISRIITTAIREISLLREYQTGLVISVATGKLDVRKVASDLLSEDMESWGEAKKSGSDGNDLTGDDILAENEELYA